MKFTDTATLAGTRTTRDGYLAAEVKCARTGCQTYLGTEIGLTDALPVTVYRPEDAVFAKDSLATFAGKPVTVDHPSEPVTSENWKDHAAGEIGDEVARDGEMIRVGIMVRDASAIQAIKDGKREISMGYSTPIEMRDGIAPDGTPYQAVQTGPITINHLALVDAARGGSELRVGDADAGKDRATWGATPITDAKEISHMADTMQNVVLGDKAVPVAAAHVADVEKFKADTAKALADVDASHKAAIEAKDEEIGTLKADLQKAKDAQPDPAALDKMVADRAALVTTVAKIAKDVKPEGLSDADLRKAAVVAKLGDDAVKDASDAEISGMFKVIAKDAGKTDPVADALTKNTHTAANDQYGWGRAFADAGVQTKKEA